MIEFANIVRINNPNWHGKAEVYYYYAELEVEHSESSDDNFMTTISDNNLYTRNTLTGFQFKNVALLGGIYPPQAPLTT